jgi:hypothetical protein
VRNRGLLRGFADVELTTGLRIYGVALCKDNKNKLWAGLLCRSWTDEHGQPRPDRDGKLVWVTVVEWRAREIRDVFSEEVVRLVREQYPTDLADAVGSGG